MARFVLYTAITGEPPWLASFLRHYRRLGVHRILVDMLSDGPARPRWHAAAVKVLREHGAEPVTAAGHCASKRDRREDIIGRHANDDDWILIADIDEFHVYPRDLRAVAAYCAANGHDHVMGRRIDRITPGGALCEPVGDHPARSMTWRAELTAHVLGGQVSKVVLARTGVVVQEGNHDAYYGSCAPPQALLVEVHDFKWHRGILAHAPAATDTAARDGASRCREADRFRALLREHQGRIPCELPSLEARNAGDAEAWEGPRPPTARAALDPADRRHWRVTRIRGARLRVEGGRPIVRTSRGREAVFACGHGLEWLWPLFDGCRTLAQLALLRQEVTGQSWQVSLSSLTGALDALEAVGAVRFTPWMPAQAYDLADIARSVKRPAGDVRLLYVDEAEPDPTRGFGFPRAARLLELMARSGFRVSCFAARDPAFRPGREVTAAKVSELRERMIGPTGGFDAIWVSRLRNLEAVLRALDGVRARPPVIFDSEAVTSSREILRRQSRGQPLDKRSQLRLVDRELDLAAKADLVLSVSRTEQDFFRDAAVTPVMCVPSPHEVAPTPARFEERSGVFFLNGMYWGATQDEAVDYLVRDIFPRFASRHEPLLWLFGYGTESLRLPAIDASLAGRVRVGGFVDDLAAMYDAHRVCVIPTRYASGVAWKAIEAMAHGVPIVTTPLIAGQLDEGEGAVLVGRDAGEFAAQVTRLYRDPQLWSRQRQSGLDFVRRECGRGPILDSLETIRRWIVYRNGPRRGNAAVHGGAETAAGA